VKAKKIDFAKLNKAVETFGSLQKANAQLEADNLALEKKNIWLKQGNEKLSVTRKKLSGQIEDMNAKVQSYQSQLQSLANQVKMHNYQYELFCGFMAMVAEAPSVTDSIDTLIALFQKLKEPGWYLPKNADEMRSLFVRTVMGDYLKCYCCDNCGVQFIVNKPAKNKYLGSGYQCPVCSFSFGVKTDDSFLEATVSGKQLSNIIHTEEVLKENEVLKPLRSFLGIPCEICHQPINEWADNNTKAAVKGLGWAHSKCWNSDVGRLKLFLISQKQIKANS